MVSRAVIFLLLALAAALAVPVISQEATPGATLEVPQYIEPQWDGTLRRIKVPILMYHYISELPDDADKYRVGLTISPAQWRAHADYLFGEGYTPISLYDLDTALLNGLPLPPKPVVLTFDDGYIDHYVNVFPVLKEYNFTATFFIITARADANDPHYLSWEQIREMADAGMSMEAHTKDHVSLAGRNHDTLIYQMLGSLESLAAYTGRQTHMFSYPGGDYDNQTLNVASTLPIWRAVTTEPGRLHTTDNRLLLQRVRIPGGIGAGGLASILRED